MNPNRAPIQDADDLDLLSAIWIIACNDESSIVTYEGIKYRLGLPPEYDVKRLITSRGELFRTSGGARRLTAWKTAMLNGGHRPQWIKNIEGANAQEKKIESLTPLDIFRTQFRAENPERSPIEIIDWGIGHIDRLRKANAEAREEADKRWASRYVPMASTFLALAAVMVSGFLQWQSLKIQNENIQTQKSLKYYEVEFPAKRDGFAKFDRSLDDAISSLKNRNLTALNEAHAKTKDAFAAIEPFLLDLHGDFRESVQHEYETFYRECEQSSDTGQPASKDYQKDKSELRDHVFKLLFPPG